MRKIILGSRTRNISKREMEHHELSKKIANEGVVLLKNNGILPLTQDAIALFGNGVRKPIKGGTGSGDVNIRRVMSVEEAFVSMGIKIETINYLNDFDAFFEKTYDEWLIKSRQSVTGIKDVLKIVEKIVEIPFSYPTDLPLKESHIVSVSTKTAVYVLSRQAGEGNDRKLEPGDYFLTTHEYGNLKFLDQHFKDIVLVINSGSAIDLSFIDEIKSISAILFVGQPGQAVGQVIAETIMGISNPSGKLTMTWAYQYDDFPNAKTYSYLSGDTTNESYIEDIYVGYRYFDSFQKEVRFPFGFGLSYTEFTQSNHQVKFNHSSCTITVDIKNIGHVSGKDIVQAYIVLPSSDIDHEYKRLVAFAKTSLLKPGQTEHVTLSFDILERCDIYHEKNSSYQLLKGSYHVLCGSSSRDFKHIKSFVLENTLNIEQCKPICQLDKSLEINPFPEKTLDIEKLNEEIIILGNVKTKKHDYDREQKINPSYDKLLSKLSIEELTELVVGNGIRGETMIQLLSTTSSTCQLDDQHGIPGILFCDGPAGLKVVPETVEFQKDQLAAININAKQGNYIDLLVNIMPSYDETAGECHYFFATAWPTATVQAQTWNLALVEEVGLAVSKEMIEFGITTWLAPGMNIQRNPLCGRNFEYYSEDPVVSGLMASALTKGVEHNPHTCVSLKHFVANNQENNRARSSSNLSERALREIYLRGFKIAVKETNPGSIMASYNKVNGLYVTNNKDLLIDIIRHEWDYKGLIITDWHACDKGRADAVKAIQSGIDLIMPGRPENRKAIIEAAHAGEIAIETLKLSASRMLDMIQKNHVFPIIGKKE